MGYFFIWVRVLVLFFINEGLSVILINLFLNNEYMVGKGESFIFGFSVMNVGKVGFGVGFSVGVG